MTDEKNNITDQALVEAAKNNPEAFGEIVNRYWKRLFGFIRRTSYFSQEDIEDILQEVFFKVYRYLNDYDSRLAFSTWIYQIARNTLIDEIRKKKTRPATIPLETEDLKKILKSGLDIEKEILSVDFMEKIRSSIFDLPYNYREILVLRFLEEKSYEEIMDILKKPKGTVAALVSRGRKILIEKIKRREIA